MDQVAKMCEMNKTEVESIASKWALLPEKRDISSITLELQIPKI